MLPQTMGAATKKSNFLPTRTPPTANLLSNPSKGDNMICERQFYARFYTPKLPVGVRAICHNALVVHLV